MTPEEIMALSKEEVNTRLQKKFNEYGIFTKDLDVSRKLRVFLLDKHGWMVMHESISDNNIVIHLMKGTKRVCLSSEITDNNVFTSWSNLNARACLYAFIKDKE